MMSGLAGKNYQPLCLYLDDETLFSLDFPPTEKGIGVRVPGELWHKQ